MITIIPIFTYYDHVLSLSESHSKALSSPVPPPVGASISCPVQPCLPPKTFPKGRWDESTMPRAFLLDKKHPWSFLFGKNGRKTYTQTPGWHLQVALSECGRPSSASSSVMGLPWLDPMLRPLALRVLDVCDRSPPPWASVLPFSHWLLSPPGVTSLRAASPPAGLPTASCRRLRPRTSPDSCVSSVRSSRIVGIAAGC